MNKLNSFLVGVAIGCFIFDIYLITENKELKKYNNNLKEENEYLKSQLKEVPTIIESHKEEICSE